MPANTDPIFALTPKIAWGTVATANTALDGTGTIVTICTAGSNGSRVSRIVCQYTGTSVATVLRVFINNGSTNVTATNNTLRSELTIAANTLSQVAQSTQTNIIDFGADGLILPNGYKLNITIGTTVANALTVEAESGDY